MCGVSSQSSVAAGLGVAARASASGCSGAADDAGPVVQQPGGRPRHAARAAEPAGAPPPAGHAGFGAAPQAAELAGDPGALPADPDAVAQAGQHPAAGAAAGAGAGRFQRRGQAPASTGARRETRRQGTRGARTGRRSASSGTGSRPGTQPGAGRAQRVQVRHTVALPPLAARRRAGMLSARVAISCAGVTPKMSHSAASTGSDSRSGVWVTSRQTCTDDSVMPRSASSGSRSAGVEQPGGGHHLPQPPLVADLPFRRHHALRPGRIAAAAVASSARRSVRVRKSEDTHNNGTVRYWNCLNACLITGSWPRSRLD